METKLSSILTTLAVVVTPMGIMGIGCSSTADSGADLAATGCATVACATTACEVGCSVGCTVGCTAGCTAGGCSAGCTAGGCSASGCASGGCSATSGCAGCGAMGTCGASTCSTMTTCGSGGGSVSSGTLTAGDWDDNLNFSYFQTYLAEYEALDPGQATFPSADRVVVHVVDDAGAPLAGAAVVVSQTGTDLFTTTTGSDGDALFFPSRDGAMASGAFDVSASAGGHTGQLTSATGTTWSITVTGATAAAPTALDVAIVLDTTGSMGDELAYLKTEVAAISSNLANEFPGVSVRYGLVLYRDQNMGDAYTTRSFDFTSSFSSFQTNLQAQDAGGGGDEPEAVELGLKGMNALSWRGGNVARVAFLIGDAPPHSANGDAYFTEIDKARDLGVHLYPIGASGVDDDAEYFFRSGAEATGGRYLFLTNDSGVGGSHQAPHFWCYDVEKLELQMERMIAAELTGQVTAPRPADVIRAVGDPMNGVCVNQTLGNAFIY